MANTVEYYLSKGFDRKAAEYFAGGKKKIVGVVANRDFTLTIRFDNGEKKKPPPVLPTPTRPPGEPGGQYSPEQTILYHLTRAKAIARAFLCPILNAYN